MANKDYGQNSCRICRKVFCCENCREEHEINDHYINPECDICISGRVLLREPSESLLKHIKERHWPLHCVHCRRVFNIVDDIFLHNKCPNGNGNNNNTPPISSKNLLNNVKSNTNQSCVATSTPVAPKEDEKQFLQKMTEVITPVDSLEKKEENKLYKSAFTPNNYSERKTEQYSKRRVTFSENIEEISDSENIPPQKSEPATPNSNYITAEMKTPTLLSSINEADEKSQNYLNEAAAALHTTENETLWESAVNESENDDISVIGVVEVEENSETYWASESEPNLTDKTGGIWSSMTNIFKNVIQGLSNGQEAKSNTTFLSLKRRYMSPDSDDSSTGSPALKKMKLTDIKCRRPIRYMKPALYVRYGRRRVNYADKDTQTD